MDLEERREELRWECDGCLRMGVLALVRLCEGLVVFKARDVVRSRFLPIADEDLFGVVLLFTSSGSYLFGGLRVLVLLGVISMHANTRY